VADERGAVRSVPGVELSPEVGPSVGETDRRVRVERLAGAPQDSRPVAERTPGVRGGHAGRALASLRRISVQRNRRRQGAVVGEPADWWRVAVPLRRTRQRSRHSGLNASLSAQNTTRSRGCLFVASEGRRSGW
jgi:hypothetical protein